MSSWIFPLKQLSPLSEHPTASPSLSPALSEGSLTLLGANVRVDQLDNRCYGASRILKAFLNCLGDDGKQALLADIEACKDDNSGTPDDSLVELANHLLDAILKPFALSAARTPPPLSTPPSQDASASIDLAMATIEASTRQNQASLRKACLRRDGYRCIYSGIWDIGSVDAGMVSPPMTEPCLPLYCAHIIPFALGSFDTTDAVQTRNSAIIWFAMHRYFPELQGKLDARSINQPANACTMEGNVHRMFDDYRLAFHPQDTMSTYRATSFGGRPLIHPRSKSGSPEVELTCADLSVPMPDPNFFKVHYIVTQILQVSGFGRQLAKTIELANLDLDCRALHPSGRTDVGAILARRLLTSACVELEGGSDSRCNADSSQLRQVHQPQEPGRYGKNGELLIDYEQTEECHKKHG